VLDLNLHIASLLDDLAAVQTSMYPRRAYERAARKVMLLPEPAREGLALPDIGKTATSVVREVLATGKSTTVSKAVEASGRRADAESRRPLREGFISLAVARMVLNDTSTKAIGLKDHRADFQMHSTWSDGSRSIAELAIACIERGYRHMAVTDHTEGLSITRGLSAAGLQAQHREIDAINETTDGRFVVFKGIEANILADGSVDALRTSHSAPAFANASAGRLRTDLVLAAPHSKLDTDEDQTRRLVKAASTPGVHILAHPSGRKFGKRPGIRADWSQVFAAAKANDVAIEIDGDPSRQDLPYALAREAYDSGCLIAIDSDAHDLDELCFAEIGLAHARLAGIPASRVINTWTTRKLEAWLRR
jgi:DNA polymerase (family 10)